MSYTTVEYMDPLPLITGENWDKEIIGKVMETVSLPIFGACTPTE